MKLQYWLMLQAMASGTLLAQEAVFVDIAPCLAHEASSPRMACYERLDATVRAARQQTAIEVPAEPQPTAVIETVRDSVENNAAPADPVSAQELAVQQFGNQTPATARVMATDSGEAELRDTITGMREREPGRWLITLASGQVWYQSNSSRIRLREGMEVRIYPSPLGGSFRMARADGNSTGFIQVSRVE